MTDSIAFIGGGNMARSLIGGLVARGHDPRTIHVAEPVQPLREALAADFGVAVFEDGARAIAGAGTWVFATKPQVLRAVCESLAVQAQATQPLVVSIAAGITAAQLERWLGGGGLPIVRTMPNTPALLGAGVTGLYASGRVDAAGRAFADALLSAAGKTVWIADEAQMDAVTAISGSGPAYVFHFIEALEAAGRSLGFDEAGARRLAIDTVLGAARLAASSEDSPAVLRQKVTSKGGTTEAALASLAASGWHDELVAAVKAAEARGRELGEQLGASE